MVKSSVALLFVLLNIKSVILLEAIELTPYVHVSHEAYSN